MSLPVPKAAAVFGGADAGVRPENAGEIAGAAETDLMRQRRDRHGAAGKKLHCPVDASLVDELQERLATGQLEGAM